MEPSCTDRGDPRLERSRRRILAAALDLLREHGASGLTVEGVSARSGVAKSTVYRQFCDRDDIHMAAIESIAEAGAMPGCGPLLDDVESGLQLLARRLRAGEFAALMATSIDAAERSERMARLAKETYGARRAWLVARLERACAHGELPDDCDVELLTSQLVGPLFYRRLISRQPITEQFVAALTRAVLSPLVRPLGASAGGAPPRSAR